VTDLSRVDALLDAIKSFPGALGSYVQLSSENWGRVAEQRTLTTSFGSEAVSQQVSAAVRPAVVYRTNGALTSNVAGMSLCFPARACRAMP